LFILAGVVAHQYGVRTLDDLARAHVRSPWILGAFVIVGVSMIGLPPTGGFFGKWYIVLSVVEAGNYVALGAIIITTLLTLAYFVRLLERLFHGAREQGAKESVEESSPLPAAFRISIAVPAAAIIGLGLFSDRIVNVLLNATSGLGL